MQLETRRAKREFSANEELKNLYAVFKRHPEAKWIIGKNDALLLYKLIKKYDAKNILDLGTGIGASAAVMALAQAPNGRVVSVEQFEKCISIANQLIPEALKRKITLLYSETYAFKNDKVGKYLYFSGYKTLPMQFAPFDFVVVDGPGAWLEESQLVALPNGDIINLLPHLATGCKVYIDGRKKNVDAYRRFLSPYLKLLEQSGHHTLFERTEKPLKNVTGLEAFDVKLAGRSSSGYFK